MSGTYRVELAPNRRAGCTNKACKDRKIKFNKGELRYGTWVEIPGGDYPASWKFKHWGCVTRKQIQNLKSALGELDYDDDKDMECLDGWDEIDEESKVKVRQALHDGEVAYELQTKFPEEEENENPEAAESPEKPKAKKSRAKKVKAEKADEEEEVIPEPKKRGKKAKEESVDDGALATESEEKPKKSRKRKAADAADDGQPAPEPKAKKARAPRKKKVGVEEDSGIGMQTDGTADAPVQEASETEAQPKNTKKAAKIKQETSTAGEDTTGVLAVKKGKKVKTEPTNDTATAAEAPAKRATNKKSSKVKTKPAADAEDAQDQAEEDPAAGIKEEPETEEVTIDVPEPAKKAPKAKKVKTTNKSGSTIKEEKEISARPKRAKKAKA